MKKRLVLVCLVFCSIAGFSQRATGDITTEIYLNNPFQVTDFFSLIDGAKVRYFLSDDMAFRTSLNIVSASRTVVDYDVDTKDDETKNSTSLFNIQPGIEYHFVNDEKFSIYAGAGIGISLGNAKASHKFNKLEKSTSSKGPKTFGFGIDAFTGIDYYFANRLYLGAEFGLGYSSLKSTAGSSTDVDGKTTDNKDYTTVSGFAFHVLPSLRFGWKF